VALDKKLLINVAGGNRVRLLPPLIINQQQADQIIEIVSDIIQSFLTTTNGQPS
jgi:acetylornithine aminotransferase